MVCSGLKWSEVPMSMDAPMDISIDTSMDISM